MTGGNARVLPQAVLREATDARLFTEVITRGRVTRAELATTTGISKPTVSESVRRLVDSGLLDATGLAETGRRGRVGTFYELGVDAGWVLAVTLNQSGVHTRATDLAATPRHDHHVPPGAPGDTQALVTALRTAVSTAVRANRGPLRAIAVSVANPVHPATREVVPLPGSPFPEGLLNPGAVLADLTPAPVLVDNDVNLAALAERHSVAAAAVSTFAYLYIGAGLGLGLYLGDRLLRGAHGLAGEIGYLPGSGEEGLAAELTGLGFGRGDVDKVLSVLDGQSGVERERAVGVLTEAIARAVVSVLAVADPELVLLGGPVGTHPALIGPVRAAVASRFPGPTRISHGSLGARAPLHGAVHLAVEHARAEAVRAPGR